MIVRCSSDTIESKMIVNALMSILKNCVKTSTNFLSIEEY